MSFNYATPYNSSLPTNSDLMFNLTLSDDDTMLLNETTPIDAATLHLLDTMVRNIGILLGVGARNATTRANSTTPITHAATDDSVLLNICLILIAVIMVCVCVKSIAYWCCLDPHWAKLGFKWLEEDVNEDDLDLDAEAGGMALLMNVLNQAANQGNLVNQAVNQVPQDQLWPDIMKSCDTKIRGL